MGEVRDVSIDTSVTGGYSPLPRGRRGNRRAQGGSDIGGSEPRLAGVEAQKQVAEISEDDNLVAWLKEQRPPHYE